MNDARTTSRDAAGAVGAWLALTAAATPETQPQRRNRPGTTFAGSVS